MNDIIQNLTPPTMEYLQLLKQQDKTVPNSPSEASIIHRRIELAGARYERAGKQRRQRRADLTTATLSLETKIYLQRLGFAFKG